MINKKLDTARKLLGFPYRGTTERALKYNPAAERIITCRGKLEYAKSLTLEIIKDSNPIPSVLCTEFDFRSQVTHEIFLYDRYMPRKYYIKYKDKNSVEGQIDYGHFIDNDIIMPLLDGCKLGEIITFDYIFPARAADAFDVSYKEKYCPDKIRQRYNDIMDNTITEDLYAGMFHSGELKSAIACLSTKKNRIKVINYLWETNIPNNRTVKDIHKILARLDAGELKIKDVDILEAIIKELETSRYYNNKGWFKRLQNFVEGGLNGKTLDTILEGRIDSLVDTLGQPGMNEEVKIPTDQVDAPAAMDVPPAMDIPAVMDVPPHGAHYVLCRKPDKNRTNRT